MGNGQIGSFTFNKGVSTVTYFVTDAALNVGTCSFTITVVDNQLPTIICPANIVQNSDPGVCGAVVNYVPPIGTDNCPGAVTIQTGGLPSGSFFPAGPPVTNTFRVTDAAGNFTTCSFTVTVIDNQLPSLTCPPNITQNVTAGPPALCTAVIAVPNPTYSDNCSVTALTWSMTGATILNSPVSGINCVGTKTFNKGVTNITYTAVDVSGNTRTCSFTVTVIDNIPPTITCPADITRTADPNACTALVNYTAAVSDNCPGVTVVYVPPSGTVFSVGTTSVTATATDASGNVASCTFNVTVVDNQTPNITCPPGSPFVRSTDVGNCYYTVQGTEFNPIAFSDNCPGVTIKNNFNNTATLAGAQLLPGTTTIVWTATDAGGLIKTCQITVQVMDLVPPIIICPNDTSIACPENYYDPDLTEIIASDNCGPVTVILADEEYEGLGISPGWCPTAILRTFRATDAGGNYTECLQTITVLDPCDCETCM